MPTSLLRHPRHGEQRVHVRTARSVDDVLALRPAWEEMGFTDAEADLELFLEEIRTRPENRRPHVVLAERGGRAQGMVMARVEDRRLESRLGYATLLRTPLRCLTVVHGGVAGPGGGGTEAELLAALLESLDRGDADALLLRYLPVDSSLFALARGSVRRARRQHCLVVEPHWVCELPADIETLLARTPRAKALRRYARKLEREAGERLEVRRFARPADLERVLADVETVAARTYQRGLGVGFDPQRDRAIIRLEMERGWFRSWVLYVDDVPCAFELGVAYAGTYQLVARGYDPEWAQLRVGNYVALEAWRDLCSDPSVRRIDFGFGDADYKREAATDGWREADLMLFAPTARAVAINGVHSAVIAADRLVRRLAGKERVARAKRRWRDLRTPT